eukprot:TRINITY_DN9998_c0_g1_i1.p3 TRINITY_DN9998_c0_g1~~TRINITY_DN9998_c0_g1_i1.p3  ORF type:complete len:146 (-),score=26.24 TRINITY_DN9998_c0_g1_i1:278-715(-)
MSTAFTCRDDGAPCACSESIAAPKFQQEPYHVKWAEGEDEDKWICQCGQSKNYPFCDGSHRAYNAEHGTNIGPLPVHKSPDGVWVCGCGHSDSRPFCSGRHSHLRRLEDETADDASDEARYFYWPWTVTSVVLLAAFAYTRFIRK